MDVRTPTSWYDFGSLAEMRNKAEQRPQAATKNVAEQFESLFLNLMLKEMRKSVSRSGLLGSQTTETYEQMFDQQISIGLARGGGIGLADFIEKQLNARAESTADVIARRSAKAVGE